MIKMVLFIFGTVMGGITIYYFMNYVAEVSCNSYRKYAPNFRGERRRKEAAEEENLLSWSLLYLFVTVVIFFVAVWL